MEMVDGVSLHEMITRQGPTSPESALAVLKGSLLGLAAAHALGIVHRDYKPENVLVDRSGESKLSDFGVAARQGQSVQAGGTPLYMAPEQWDGAPATPATDIYAATVVFFECLTGKTPFSGRLRQLAAQHAAAGVPVELVDEPLRELIARGMAKNPAERPANATALVTELEATAAAAYGTDWESRGRVQLAERVAALLLLLLAHGGAAAGAGLGDRGHVDRASGVDRCPRGTARLADRRPVPGPVRGRLRRRGGHPGRHQCGTRRQFLPRRGLGQGGPRGERRQGPCDAARHRGDPRRLRGGHLGLPRATSASGSSSESATGRRLA